MTSNAIPHAERVAELVRQRRRFVRATVVRAQCPTSTRPGDAAIILPDGTVEGFVGGQCAEGSVRTAALGALDDGNPVLLRILPDDANPFPDSPGAITVQNPCLSGGAIEVFIEPNLPAPRVVVVGDTPIGDALIALGTALGYAMDRPADAPGDLGGATAVVIASHGRNEPETIRAALDAGVGFIGLVASATRGRAVLEELALDPDESDRVHSPVGDDIGARTATEIALSIVSEIVRAIRVDGLSAAPGEVEPAPAQVVDPVCGMTVIVSESTPHCAVDGVDYWFCNPGCRAQYESEHACA